MRTAIIAVMVLTLTNSIAFAQGRSADANATSSGMGSKTMDSCTMDRKKFCSGVSDSILKECLVKNWDNITGDCQDALGIPFDGASHGGKR